MSTQEHASDSIDRRSMWPNGLRPLLLGLALVTACLTIRSYPIDSSVVQMELRETAPDTYVADARVNVPDFNKEMRASVKAIRDGGPIHNFLPYFETERRLDLRIVRSRSRILRLVPLTESFQVEMEISVDNGDGTRSVRQHHADSMIELSPEEALMQTAAIEELERLGYQRAADLLSSGEYSEPTRIKLQGVLLLSGAALLPVITSLVTRGARAESHATGSNSTTPLPSPTTPKDSQI